MHGELLEKPVSAGESPELTKVVGGGDPIEVSGRIKWFDAEKGYGFIAPDDRGRDILIRTAVLKSYGLNAIGEGSRVVVQAIRREKGLMASKVISAERGSNAVRLLDRAPQPFDQLIGPAGTFMAVRVKLFNRDRGYGFLTRGTGTPDIFVHVDVLERCGFPKVLVVDEFIQARFGEGPKGLIAVEVRQLEAVR